MKNYAHQQRIIDADPKVRGLFLGTGSGKTRTACQLARGNTLVICPKTIRDEKIWEKEWETLGFPEKRLTVLSKEDFKKNVWNLPKYDTVIGDEAHTLAGVQPAVKQRNYVKYPRTSQIYEKVYEYIKRANPKRIYMLTATPMPNPMVVYGIGTLLGKRWNFFRFRDAFYVEKGRNIWLVNRSKQAKERLAKAVNMMGEVGRLEDWFDVPEQTYRNHFVDMTPEQKKLIKDVELEYPDPLVQLGKRHQLDQGIYEGEVVKENKTKAIEQYAQEFDKIVVFARYRAQIEHYAQMLGKNHKVFILTGDTKNRDELLTKARNANKSILIVQSSISAGWEIPEFPCMIFASESYSYIDREQAEGRILRANHLKKNLYVTLIAGEVDKKVRTVIANKEDFVEHMHAEALCKK